MNIIDKIQGKVDKKHAARQKRHEAYLQKRKEWFALYMAGEMTLQEYKDKIGTYNEQ